MISIYTLTSPLHDGEVISKTSEEFLSSLSIDYELRGEDFRTYGDGDLDLIYIRTGGTEGLFKPLLPHLRASSSQPIYLLSSRKNNSLAASMEILSYLRSQGVRGQILHGDPSDLREKILSLEAMGRARRSLMGKRYALIGEPSDWLISSALDREKVKEKLGIEIIDISIQELFSEIALIHQDEAGARLFCGEALFDAPESVKASAGGSYRIYVALRNLMDRYSLSGFTLRCFDLLSTVRNTGCLALAKLNSEGYVAGCEGDGPAMLSMAVSRALLGVSGFQANPSSIDPSTGEITFAHCTIPLDMVTRYTLDTHFESGIGIGVRGHMREGDVTVFKLSGDLSRHYIGEGTLLRNTASPNLCRTQLVLRLPSTDYFLEEPIGNHHIILPGHCGKLLGEFLS